MSKRRMKSVADELIKKSREAMMAAVQIYNNPQMTFKSESFISLAVIAWTYLFHAYYRKQGIDYRYYHTNGKKKIYDKTKHGAFKHWELERCINCSDSPIDKETAANLRFIIGIRHEIEHQMTDKIDEYLSAKLQACAINFDYYIQTLFGDKYSLSDELALAIQFSPISPEQKAELQENKHITTNVRNFIVEFENNLSDDSLRSSRYAYRVLFLPINVNRKGQADQVVEFIKSDSPMADSIEKTYAMIKETEKRKYLPSQIVKIMQEEGFRRFSIVKHTELWKSKNAKSPDLGYGVQVANTWYWYEKWLDEVRKYCISNQDILKGEGE